MEVINWADSDETIDSNFCIKELNDEENLYMSGSIPRLQFRKEASIARWVQKMGMAEVIERKGGMWTTTGIVRQGKLYCLIEEALFLVERGALILLNGDTDTALGLKEIYGLVQERTYGSSWECFEAYRHLKSLGYVVGRHNLPWTLKSEKISTPESFREEPKDRLKEGVSLSKKIEAMNFSDREKPHNFSCIVMSEKCCSSEHVGVAENCEQSNNELGKGVSLSKMIEDKIICAKSEPIFDVYLPDRRFRKSAPVNPSFVLCAGGEEPPIKAAVKRLSEACGEIPLKFFQSESGRLSFFEFEKVELPILP
ncbi:hypothetical protein AMTRI_Chr03g50940 [Amborella trichopoda]